MPKGYETLADYEDHSDDELVFGSDSGKDDSGKDKSKTKKFWGISLKYILAAVVILILCFTVIYINSEPFGGSRGRARRPLKAPDLPTNYNAASSPEEIYVGPNYTTRLAEKLSWRDVEAQEIDKGSRRIPGRVSVGTTESFLECEAKVNAQPSLVLGSAVWYPDGECTARVA